MNTSQEFTEDPLFGSGNKFDVKKYLAKVKQNWFWLLISLIFFVLISYLYIRYATPIYSTTASVLIKEDENASGESGLLKAFGGDMAPTSSTETEAEIFKTQMLMERVVKKLNANIIYFAKGKVKDVELDEAPFKVHVLGNPEAKAAGGFNVEVKDGKYNMQGNNWNKTVNLYEAVAVPGLGNIQLERGELKAEPGKIYAVSVVPVKAVVGSFLKKLQVAIPSKQVNIINLSFSSPLPAYSEVILNTLIETYIQSNILDKNTVADSTISFINERLMLVSSELSRVEGNVEAFRKENKVTDIAAQSAQLITSSSESVNELAKVETQLSIIGSLEQYLGDEGNAERVMPSGVFLEDPNFTALMERYNTIVLEKERSKLSQTEGNPYVQNLNTQIAGVRSDMLKSIGSLKRSLTIAKNSVQGRTNKMDNQAGKVPTIQRKYLDLERQQQIKQELYVFLLQKKEETAISKTSNISNCKVIEKPISTGPISPNGKSIIGYGIFAGLFLPLGIIYLLDILNTTVKSKDDILAATHVPVIAEIGISDSADTIVVGNHSRTAISEQFRNLRTSLSFFLKEGEKTILITSSMGGEGKSFCSINLAATIALTGKKVVIMEMDLRKPNLSNKFNLSNSVGYTNFITSPAVEINDIVVPSGIQDNLFVIGSGPIPPNPAELILNERLGILMTALKADFDYIIVDAPPLGLVTDAQLLSTHANLTLYVVRENYTHKEQLEITEDIFRTKKIERMTILLNGAAINKNYGYGYGYGNEEETATDSFKKFFKKSK